MEKKDQKISNESITVDTKAIDIMQVLLVLWDSRKLIGIVVGSITVLAIVISLILPEYFKSTAIILPDTDKSRLASLGGVSDLAALAGVSVGGEGSLIKLYPTIIKSESVPKNVLFKKYKTKEFSDSVNLLQYWEIEEKTPERSYEAGLKTLQDGLNISSDIKLSIVTISIETREPQLSADIINTTIMELDRFIRTKRNTNASEQRKWIEGRLIEVKADLSKAENILKEFREKNRVVTGSPQLLLEQERLAREVQINTTIYIELKKQYEIVKIEEIKNIPIINVLDYGRPAAKKDKPKRSIIVIVSFFLAFAGSIGYVIVRDNYGNKLTDIIHQFTMIKKV